ncbi:MAG: hypothetical protein U0470_04095 [Anaerolineae bacterium]
MRVTASPSGRPSDAAPFRSVAAGILAAALSLGLNVLRHAGADAVARPARASPRPGRWSRRSCR